MSIIITVNLLMGGLSMCFCYLVGRHVLWFIALSRTTRNQPSQDLYTVLLIQYAFDVSRVSMSWDAHTCTLMSLCMYWSMQSLLLDEVRGRIFGTAFRSLWAHHMPVAAQWADCQGLCKWRAAQMWNQPCIKWFCSTCQSWLVQKLSKSCVGIVLIVFT